MLSNEDERPALPAFRTASFCAAGECVEIAQQDDRIILRDSTQPHGSLLRYGFGEWRNFVSGIKTGKFDDLSL